MDTDRSWTMGKTDICYRDIIFLKNSSTVFFFVHPCTWSNPRSPFREKLLGWISSITSTLYSSPSWSWPVGFYQWTPNLWCPVRFGQWDAPVGEGGSKEGRITTPVFTPVWFLPWEVALSLRRSQPKGTGSLYTLSPSGFGEHFPQTLRSWTCRW